MVHFIFIQVAVIGHTDDSPDFCTALADRFSTEDDEFKPELWGADEAVQSQSGVIESADHCGELQAHQCEKVCIEDSLKKSILVNTLSNINMKIFLNFLICRLIIQVKSW